MTRVTPEEQVKIDAIVSQLKSHDPKFSEWATGKERLKIAEEMLFRERVASAMKSETRISFSEGNFTKYAVYYNVGDPTGELELEIERDPSSHKEPRANIRVWKKLNHPREGFAEGVKAIKDAGGECVTSMSVSMLRDPHVIAESIKKKIIPSAIAATAKAVEIGQARSRNFSRMREFVSEFLAQVPGARVSNHVEVGEFSASIWMPGSIHEVQLSCYSDGARNISFRCSSAPADKVIEFLRSMAKEKN